MKHGEEPASPHLLCPQYIHPLMNRSARPRAHWRWRLLLPPKKTDANATFHFLRENRHQGSIKTNVSGRGRDGRELRWQFREGGPFLQKLPPSPSNLSMHLNADGLMNTSLTERGGLPLLAAWLAGASVCAVFALIACFALPVVFSAQGGQIFSWVWRPDTHEFGILTMIVGSLLLSVSALLLSWPLAVGVACAIQDGGKKRLFGCTVAGIVRFMTTIPTVVYGFAAVFLLVPVVREAAGKGSGLCWLSAALMLALLILPTMVLVMDSAMRTKERNVRITAAALGFTRSQTLACLVLPASRRWLLTAAILGFGRAAAIR